MATEKKIHVSKAITMQKNTHTIDVNKETVTLCHVTKTADGHAMFQTTFIMKDLKPADRLKRIADDAVIGWRQSAGVKELTSAELEEKGLLVTTVDLSKTVTREKHIETPTEKRTRELVNIISKSPKGSAERENARKELLAMWAEADEAKMEAGENN